MFAKISGFSDVIPRQIQNPPNTIVRKTSDTDISVISLSNMTKLLKG